jgi:uroporphyrinogen decarboxylase
VARWHIEGLPEDVSPAEYFEFEFSGMGFDSSFRFEQELVEETDEYRIERDGNGTVRKNWKHTVSTPEMIGFTVNTKELWEEHKERLAWDDSRVDWDNALENNRAEVEKGKFVHFSCINGYDHSQAIVGSEELLMAMVDSPEWIDEMMATWADQIITAVEEMLSRGFHFDGAWAFNDMGYRNALLFSPSLYREMIYPHDKRMNDVFHSHGLPVILHSCGRVSSIVPDLIDAGFDCIQPLETKAGMDLIQLKKDFGDRLSFMGGIDVRKMADPDPSVIEEEIRTKLTIAKKDGGYIYHSDHSVPDDVSFPQYERVIELVRKYGSYNGG